MPYLHLEFFHSRLDSSQQRLVLRMEEATLLERMVITAAQTTSTWKTFKTSKRGDAFDANAAINWGDWSGARL